MTVSLADLEARAMLAGERGWILALTSDEHLYLMDVYAHTVDVLFGVVFVVDDDEADRQQQAVSALLAARSPSPIEGAAAQMVMRLIRDRPPGDVDP